MKRFLPLILGLIAFNQLYSQTAREVGVEIRAQLNASKYLQLSWLQQSGSTRYQVYTKNAANDGWDRIADLQGSDTIYIDSTYKIGTKKEYKVARTSNNYTGFDGNGYMVAGFDIPAQEFLGRALVIIEDIYKTTAQELLVDYLNQITNEGYFVDTHYVNKNDGVKDIKDWISKKWSADKNVYTTVLLLGRVPVPYSGDYRPDGHTDHTGAWPADLYYGSFDINWTDNTVNNSSATYSRNHNTPGDGKFDISKYNSTSQTTIQKVNIPVGRVDLSNMSSFGTDTSLIKRYLIKSLAFRTGQRKAQLKTLVDDNFGFFNSEAFASGGFRNGSTFSKWDISTADYRTEMSKNSYLLSYGCGAGSYTSCSGVSSSSAFVGDSLLNPFTLMFGSYFGDWDNSDNLLRAPLASKGWGLVSVWAGRPYWMMHPCALGAPVAEATLITQNTWKIYNAAGFQSGVHVALMGDPTLRMFAVDNVHSLKLVKNCDASVDFLWGDVKDLADSIIIENWDGSSWLKKSTLSGTDTGIVMQLGKGQHKISIRFLKLMESGSGTWWQYGARRIESFELDSIPAGKILGDVAPVYCNDSTYTFINDGDFNSNTTSIWTWNQQNESAPKGDTFTIINPQANGTLMITRFSKDGCIFIDSVSIAIQKMDYELDTKLREHYCLEAAYEFKDEIGSDTTILNKWNWMGNEIQRGLGDTFSLSSVTPGTQLLYLLRESKYGCKFNDSWSLVFSKPEKPVILEVENIGRIGDTIKLKSASNYHFYEWNNGLASQDSGYVFVAELESEMVSLVGIDSMGCRSDSTLKRFAFVVNRNHTLGNLNVSAYPNPFDQEILISVPHRSSLLRTTLTDIKGVNHAQLELKSGIHKLDVDQLPGGIYYLKLTDDVTGETSVIRLVK